MSAQKSADPKIDLDSLKDKTVPVAGSASGIREGPERRALARVVWALQERYVAFIAERHLSALEI